MKRIMCFALVAMLMTACSNDEEIMQPPIAESGVVTFQISTDSGLNPLTKGNIYSQDSAHQVTRIALYMFNNTGLNYVYHSKKDVVWAPGVKDQRFPVQLPPGNYKCIAVGRTASDLYTLAEPAVGQSSDTFISATIANSEDVSDIFSANKDFTVAPLAQCVPITLKRSVAGIMGYFKNIPATIGGKEVAYICLKISGSNKKINLHDRTGGTSSSSSYNLINIALSGQTKTPDGYYTGNTIPNIVKLPNTQLGGNYVIPVGPCTMNLELHDAAHAIIKSWDVINSSGTTQLNFAANDFYSLGKKLRPDCIDGGTPGAGTPEDNDFAVDLSSIDQCINLNIESAWNPMLNIGIKPSTTP
ncbi:MAG: FimB/Mfa2 family fimbrial subunit [Tannerellaceae bacterium]